MKVNVTLYDNSLTPVKNQEYDLVEYLSKLKNRVIDILYQIEGKKGNGNLDDVKLYIKKIYYEMNSIDELTHNSWFFSSLCNIHSVGTMIEIDEPFNTIRSVVLETANNIVRIGGDE